MNKMEGFAFKECQTLGLFAPWQYGILMFAPTGPRCAHPSANTLCGFYGHTNEVKGQLLCYLDAYERLVLIGFRFI